MTFGGMQGTGIATVSNDNSPGSTVHGVPVPYPPGGILGPDYKGYISGDTSAKYAHFKQAQPQTATAAGPSRSGSNGSSNSNTQANGHANANGSGNTRSAHISPTMPHDTVPTDDTQSGFPGGGLTKEMEAIFLQYNALDEGTNQVKSFGFGMLRDGPVPIPAGNNGAPAPQDGFLAGTERFKQFGYGTVEDPASVTTQPAQTQAPRTTQTGDVPAMEATTALPDGGTRWKWKWN